MIKVVFKLNKSEGYGTDEFIYANYEGAQVNDIVVVNTRYGYALAKVTAVDIIDDRFSENKLADVKKIVDSAAEQKERIDRLNAYNTLAKKIKRHQIEGVLGNFCNEQEQELIKTMTDEELDIFYKTLMK